MHEIEELLPDYVDDELSSDQRMKVEKHLSVCMECKHQVELLVQMKQDILQAYSFIQPDDHFEELVMENIGSYKQQLKRKSKVMHVSLSIVVSALFLFLFLQTSSILYAIFQVLFAFIHVGMSLVGAIVTIVSSVPNVIEIVVISTVFIFIFSSLSIYRLLRTKAIS